MSSLWKHPNSPYWFCCYTTADGRRLKKSTKQTNRTKATEVCLAIGRAETVAKSGAMTEAAAKKIIGEILERTTGHKLQDHRAGEWLDRWIAMKKQSRQGSTAAIYAGVVDEFKQSLGARALLPLAAISPHDITKFRNAELAAGKSAKTANHAVVCLGVAFNHAFRTGAIPSNPCAAVETLPETTVARDTFTAEQVSKLIAAAPGDWKRAIVFGFYTGARLGDIAAMKWSMIDLKAQTITFQPKKTKKKIRQVVIPIHPALETALLKSPGVGAAPVFPTLFGDRTGGGNGLSTQFSRIMSAAKILPTITKPAKKGKGRLQNSLSFHSLRHSFNSALANADVPQELRMKLTGHTKAATNTIYTHHELDVLRAAVEKIPAVG